VDSVCRSNFQQGCQTPLLVNEPPPFFFHACSFFRVRCTRIWSRYCAEFSTDFETTGDDNLCSFLHPNHLFPFSILCFLVTLWSMQLLVIMYLSIYPSIHPSVPPSLCLSVCLPNTYIAYILPHRLCHVTCPRVKRVKVPEYEMANEVYKIVMTWR
jgi:hypothetical protein